MKKYLFPILLLFIGINSNAQNKISASDVMQLNNGADIFTKLIESTSPNIAEDKQDAFKQEAKKMSDSKLSEAKSYFEKKYNQNDLNEIYTELKQEDRVSYSEKATGFVKEWRGFKTEFQSQFKQLYNSYQK
jgi:hypothetical protein